MSVTGAEACHKHRLLVRLVVSIGVLQIDCFGCVLDHRTAAVNHDGGWNRKTFGEDRELVSHVVAVGVFANSNTVAVLSEFVGIIERFADPQASAFVPVHCDRLGEEVAFVGVQSQSHSFRHRIVLH